MRSQPSKPTRAELLRIIMQVQMALEDARAAYDNDRAPCRASAVHAALDKALDLCVQARAKEQP